MTARPRPFFAPANSVFLEPRVNATPSEIFLRLPGNAFRFIIIQLTDPAKRATLTYNLDFTSPITGRVDYTAPDGNIAFLEEIPLDGDGRLVVGRLIPEPSSALLFVLALSCLSWLRQS